MHLMLDFTLSERYQGAGGTAGLDRGLLVCDGGTLLVEEGMGLGAVALQTGGFTYFGSIAAVRRPDAEASGAAQDPADAAREAAAETWDAAGSGRAACCDGLSAGRTWEAEYSIDRRLVWKILGTPSVTLTRLLEAFVTNTYMKREKAQPRLLAIGARLARLFRVEAHFEPVPAKGRLTVAYRTGPAAVDISVSGHWAEPRARLFIMNELGGRLFDTGLLDGAPVAPPTGWQRPEGFCELYSPTLGLAFSLEEAYVPASVQSTLFWGREVTDQFYWAGFESDLQCAGYSLAEYRYRIRFRRTGPAPAEAPMQPCGRFRETDPPFRAAKGHSHHSGDRFSEPAARDDMQEGRT